MTWNDLTISQFNRISGIIESGHPDDLETQIELLSVCSGKAPEYYLDMPLNKLKEEIKGLEGLNRRKEVAVREVYNIGGRQYRLTTQLDNMKTGQYIDYTTIVRDQPQNRAMIMATLLVPKGKEYGEGYRITDVAAELENHMLWVDVEAICFFFQLLFTSYTKAKLSSLTRKLKKEMRREKKDPQRAAVIGQAIRAIQTQIAGIK